MEEIRKCTVIFDMSEDARIKEAVRMREKMLHDKASELFNAEQRGIEKGKAEGRAEIIRSLKAYGMTDEQINAALSADRVLRQ